MGTDGDTYEPKHADGHDDRRDKDNVIPHQKKCPPHQPVTVGNSRQCRLCGNPC